MTSGLRTPDPATVIARAELGFGRQRARLSARASWALRGGVGRFVEPEVSFRARVYGRTALGIAAAMGRYVAAGEADGLRAGLRALRHLAAEVGTEIVGSARTKAPMAPKAQSPRICPVCGWSGARFAPHYYYAAFHDDARCPRCGSKARTRLLKLLIEYHPEIAPRFAASGFRVLDVGPEPYGRGLFPDGVDYTSLDRDPRRAAICADLSRVPFADRSFDGWVCFHVLDYVADDQAAINELYRLLRRGGVGLLDNDIDWQTEATVQYDRPQAGDSYHIRSYGRELLERLEGVGFEVTPVLAVDLFCRPSVARFGLGDRPLLVCRRPDLGQEATPANTPC